MKKTLFCVLLGVGMHSAHLWAQIPPTLQGNYRLISGYTSGIYNGSFAFGTATVFASGRVMYTDYYPFYKATTSGRGSISKNGLFSFSNGVSGKAQIYSNRIGFGIYKDAYGSGYFCVSK